MIVPNYFEDLSQLHVNTLPARAYYIPASCRRDDLVEHRERSDRLQMLTGDWKFRYYPNVREVTEEFYREDFDAAEFDALPVPSVWQSHGYDNHHYVNTRFPFPFDPPYVPWENPCGAYIRKFFYEPDSKAPRTYLTFEGVDSCYYVWLNGSFVGYSQVSHAHAEFDVTDLLHSGENTLAVLVLKWCDGSYMEDQDKFRTSGIFRDVYLLKRPQSHIRDYFVKADCQGNVRVAMDFCGSAAARLSLYDENNTLVAQAEAKEMAGDGRYTHQVEMTVRQPRLWNPEQPYLYTLLLETKDEVITDQLGFRQIAVKDNVVYLNGNAIKFRGINRHDSDPVVGPAVDLEHIKRDLRMFKEFNFNAVRTSHYPNAPMFYQLCDRYGFMVIDEADHESHGCDSLRRPADSDRSARWAAPMADNPLFTEATVDRVRLCVHRDKNRPCVLIWSMGNECAFGCAFETALAWTKAFDPDRLTHYESALYCDHTQKHDYSNIDLFSYMYAKSDRIHTYFNEKNPDKPFILCEYAHAMGNGPGDLEDYWQLIQQYDGLCGAFVWEWCDHAVYKGVAPNGKPMYWYGGDHGEFPHDSNFCVDGLVYPDRRPSTGLWEYWNVHRPARVAAWENGLLTLHNYMDFLSLDEYVTARFVLQRSGEVLAEGACPVPNAAPHTEAAVQLPLEIPETGRSFLRVLYYSKLPHELLPAGSLLGFDEVTLGSEEKQQPSTAVGNLTVEEDEVQITVTGQNFAYCLQKRDGMLSSMVIRGEELLQRSAELNIWRAPTDNDRKIKKEWIAAGYNRAVTRAYDFQTAVEENGAVHIAVTASVSAVFLQRFLEVSVHWTVQPSGTVSMDVKAVRNVEFPVLPRLGLRLFLPNTMDQVEYSGIGPRESYIDKHHAGWHDVFRAQVQALHEDYIRPQENGSHWDCDYVAVQGGGRKLTVTADRHFSFNASRYTQEELTQKAHSYELEECGSVVLCLDGYMAGIGSNSCGPVLKECYQVRDEVLAFTLHLTPQI